MARQLLSRISDFVWSIGSNDYFAVGILERKDWQRGMTQPLSKEEKLGALHDFKDHLQFEPTPRWELDQQRKPRWKTVEPTTFEERKRQARPYRL